MKVFFCHVTILCIHAQSQRECFDVYVIHLESVELNRVGSRLYKPEVIESDWIIPSLNTSDVGGGNLTLNVTTNSTLSTNMFYRATLITTMDMVEAGDFQFCKCTVT